jgi:hypothetical protein
MSSAPVSSGAEQTCPDVEPFQWSLTLNIGAALTYWRIEFLMDKAAARVLLKLGSDSGVGWSLENMAFKAFGALLNRE